MWHQDIQDGIIRLHHPPVRSTLTDLDPIFRALAAKVESRPEARWLVDMSAFERIGSAALGSLLEAGKRVTAAQGAMALIKCQPMVLKVFEAVRLVNLIKYYRSENLALRYLNQNGQRARTERIVGR